MQFDDQDVIQLSSNLRVNGMLWSYQSKFKKVWGTMNLLGFGKPKNTSNGVTTNHVLRMKFV